MDKFDGELEDHVAKRFELWTEIASMFLAEGQSISRELFTLNSEDLIWVLVDLVQEGKVTLEELWEQEFMFQVETVYNELNEELDWLPSMRRAVFVALSEMRGAKIESDD